MIVIISIAEDVSTNDVIDWILHFEGSFFRINSINDMHHYLTKVNNISLLPNKPENNIESVWYRRMPSREILDASFLLASFRMSSRIFEYQVGE